MIKSKFDFLIVGSGFFGLTFARLATDAGKSCFVIDRLPYVAGASADKRWDNGVLVALTGATSTVTAIISGNSSNHLL